MRMPKSLRPKVKAFDPCWERAEWSSILRFFGGENFNSSRPALDRKIKELTNYHPLTTNSGREAIFLGVKHLDLVQGDEVICPSFTCPSAVRPLLWAGLRPVFADIDHSLCIDPESVRKCVSEKTKAVLMVHQFGKTCNVSELKEIANDKGLFLIDDAASAFGARYHGQMAGTLGDVGVYSFNYPKILTSVGGGAILSPTRWDGDGMDLPSSSTVGVRTRTVQLIGRTIRHSGLVRGISMGRRVARLFRRGPSGQGGKFLDNRKPSSIAGIQAELALIQMNRIGMFLKSRRRNYLAIRHELEGIDGVELTEEPSRSDAHFYFPVILRRGHRYDLGRFLAKKGFETTWDYFPLHLQNLGVSGRASLSRTEDVWRRIILLPTTPNIIEEDSARMGDLVGRWVQME